ncbi:MAG: alpha-N-arabinofuranosidase [Clostridia bacterium]|nr:alpha-N-arabinofuranosidase [Clostridia bacterium]
MENRLVIRADAEKSIIDPMVYGHFAEHLGTCIYGGIWVGEDSPIPNTRGIRNDVVEALRKMKIPCLRWPGGCFADEYHWKDGIGPREQRKKMINTHWGGVIENNHFGTHEFLDLCEQLGTEPYICGNVGSGTVQEMSEWIEYITFDGESPMTELRRKNGRDKPWKLKYFGIGNENWGCGGRMTAEYYSGEFNRYNVYARNYGENKLFRVAAGPRNDNYHWMEVLMSQAGMHMDGIGLHYYTRLGDPVVEVTMPDGNRRYLRDPARGRTSATEFGEKEWFGIMKSAIRTEELVEKNCRIMDKYDPEKRVALIVDEWGTWFDCEPGTNPGFLYQQNTLRDAVSAGTSLNIFNNHADRVRMTNIAQTINVLQAVILTDGGRMILTPTYHVYDLYQVHQGARLLDSTLTSADYAFGAETLKQVNASVSRNAEGVIHVTFCNLHPDKPARIRIDVEGIDAVRSVEGKVLTSPDMRTHNTFERPDALEPAGFTDVTVDGASLDAVLPAKSVVRLALRG